MYSQSGIVQFSDTVVMENILFSHAFVTKCLPAPFKNFFILTSEIHD